MYGRWWPRCQQGFKALAGLPATLEGDSILAPPLAPPPELPDLRASMQLPIPFRQRRLGG